MCDFADLLVGLFLIIIPLPISFFSKDDEIQESSQQAERLKQQVAEQDELIRELRARPLIQSQEVNGKEYHLLRQLGRGGSSKVYCAYDPVSKAEYALKVVELCDEDTAVAEAYRKEMVLLKLLQKSNKVVKFYDSCEKDGKLFMVLEKGAYRLDAMAVRYFWKCMLQAVDALHNADIVHSDLKPANFLHVGGELKIIDLGIASAVPSNRTSATVAVQELKPAWARMAAIRDDKMAVPYPKCEAIDSNPHLFDCLKSCLDRNPRERARVWELLQHDYLTAWDRYENLGQAGRQATKGHYFGVGGSLGAFAAFLHERGWGIDKLWKTPASVPIPRHIVAVVRGT